MLLLVQVSTRKFVGRKNDNETKGNSIRRIRFSIRIKSFPIKNDFENEKSRFHRLIIIRSIFCLDQVGRFNGCQCYHLQMIAQLSDPISLEE